MESYAAEVQELVFCSLFLQTAGFLEIFDLQIHILCDSARAPMKKKRRMD